MPQTSVSKFKQSALPVHFLQKLAVSVVSSQQMPQNHVTNVVIISTDLASFVCKDTICRMVFVMFAWLDANYAKVQLPAILATQELTEQLISPLDLSNVFLPALLVPCLSYTQSLQTLNSLQFKKLLMIREQTHIQSPLERIWLPIWKELSCHILLMI
jgi:hypothetical protein